MDFKRKLELITRNTQEIVKNEELIKLLKKNKKPSIYIGVAITGKPHLGYFTWVFKIADFLKAGFKVKLLLADLHGALDKTPWDLVNKRFKYYQMVIPEMFKAISVDIKNIEIIKGTDFQLSKKYIFDVLKMSTYANIHDCKKASSDVVKQSDNPRLAGVIYPIMQALDEQYLEVDMQLGGVDQRKIMMFARENLPKLNYKPRIEVMLPLIPGLTESGKMSASDPKSKIELTDDEKIINKKINSAYCPAGEIQKNGVLAICKYLIMTQKEDNKKSFIIERPDKFGGNLTFKNYEEIEKIYQNNKLHPLDLKTGVAKELNKLIKPVRTTLLKKKKIIQDAYPED